MCRLMAYIGPETLVADVLLWPARSIIKVSQSGHRTLLPGASVVGNNAGCVLHLIHTLVCQISI